MLKDGFLRFCDDPEIACCRAEVELGRLRTENAQLRAELQESQRRAAAAVEVLKRGGDACHPFRNEHGEFEEVTLGYLHQPTDNRRKPYFYWVAVSDYGDMVRAESICPGSKYITHWMPLPAAPEQANTLSAKNTHLHAENEAGKDGEGDE